MKKKEFMKYVFFKVDWSGQYTLHEDGMDPLDMLSLVKMLVKEKIGGLNIDAVIEMLKKHKANLEPAPQVSDTGEEPCQRNPGSEKPSAPSRGPSSVLDFPDCKN